MRRLSLATAVFALAGLLLPASSYAQQSLNFYVGGFVPKAEQNRDRQDVLWNNLDFLSFRTRDFNGPTAGAEYVVGLNEFLDAGLGVGVYSQRVPSVYASLVNSNGSEIEQDLKLRMVPFTATVRFLPLGRTNGIVPYIGAGVAVINWRYTEVGQFVDFTDRSIFSDEFTGKGTATGPTILGGVTFPIADRFSMGGEIRWQRAMGDLPKDLGFAGDKIDLGGTNYLLTFKVKF
ncbi:MAG: outer membrane beta-barrel protein [Acidobacteria bacterium]|nr:outer membrane beta-barrel protein [Acidobacteriota bacterium]